MASIRVLIVDSQALFRESLGAILAAQDSFVVVGDASDAATAARMVASLHPDVIVTDLRLPDCRGAEAIGRILAEQGDARIVALTALDDEETVAAAVAAGVQGYVLKSRQAADLVQAIRTVARGGAALDPLVTPIIWRRFQQLGQGNDQSSAPAASDALTPFERDALGLIAAGNTTRQIAEKLSSSANLIERALADVCGKLHARNRTQAVVIALNRGLLAPP